MKITKRGRTTTTTFQSPFEFCMWVARRNFNYFRWNPALQAAEKALENASHDSEKREAKDLIKACKKGLSQEPPR